jgi:SAM-dependent methyltransferase
MGAPTAQRTEGFDPAGFAELAAIEPGSFWFETRNELIVWALGRYFPGASAMLEVGCGTGFVLGGVARARPHMRLIGSELFAEGLAYAKERAPGAELIQMDARRIPYDAELDVVGAFDVLEHIDEDEEVLGQMRRALRPGGGILITVPQHRWLWSPADEAAHHVRRYTRAELVGKVKRAGFEVERVTSFVSSLLPLMAASRFVKRHRETEVSSEFKVGRATNAALTAALRAELALIRRGVSFPAGGSLLVAARLPGAP